MKNKNIVIIISVSFLLIILIFISYDFKRNMFRFLGIWLYWSDCWVFGRCLSFKNIEEAEIINSKIRGLSQDNILWDEWNGVYTLYSKRYQNATYSGYITWNPLADRSILLNEYWIAKIWWELYTFLYEQWWRRKLDCMWDSLRKLFEKEMWGSD